MKDADYPSQYKSSEEGSASAQKSFLRSAKTQLIAISVVAALGGLSYAVMWKGASLILVATTILLIINIIISFIDRSRRFSETWYACRTVAESTKKITWQYMMGAEPYELQQNERELYEKFIAVLEMIRRENKEAAAAMASHPASGTQLTEKMKEVRSWDWKKKLDFYKEYRLEDQRAWYSDKASFNRKRENSWFYVSVAFQLIAIVLGILFISGFHIYNPIGLLMTLTAAVVAWSQLKRHKQLAISYNFVAQELADLKVKIEHTKSDNDLAENVKQVEDSISKEHTFWRAMII